MLFTGGRACSTYSAGGATHLALLIDGAAPSTVLVTACATDWWRPLPALQRAGQLPAQPCHGLHEDHRAPPLTTRVNQCEDSCGSDCCYDLIRIFICLPLTCLCFVLCRANVVPNVPFLFANCSCKYSCLLPIFITIMMMCIAIWL